MSEFEERRRLQRRVADANRNLPVPAGLAKAQAQAELHGDPAFAAQLLGQPGVKRGLKAGPEVIDTARAAYLETEYSGPADRRPPKGLLRKTEI